jgi:hypothetical protein
MEFGADNYWVFSICYSVFMAYRSGTVISRVDYKRPYR